MVLPRRKSNTSNLENPIVVYSSPGSYDVTLKVTDTFGTAQTIPNLITYTDTVFPITNSNSLYERFNSSIFSPIRLAKSYFFLFLAIYSSRYRNKFLPDTVAM